MLPQQDRVVMLTALTTVVRRRSALHHGENSLAVSEHLPPDPLPPASCKLLRSPSTAFKAEPPRAVLD